MNTNPEHNEEMTAHNGRGLLDISVVQNGQYFHDNSDHSVAFIVIVYKDGTRVTRLEDSDGSLLELAGDIRDSKEHITTAINGIEFYKTQAKHSDTNEKQRSYGKQQTR